MPGRPQSPTVRRDCTHNGRHKHGTTIAYKSDRCRCPECRAACAAYYRARSRQIAYGTFEPQPSATASTRRLQALSRLGWSAALLEQQTGLYRTHIQMIRAGRVETVAKTTEAAIADAYDRLWDQKPPARTRNERGAVARARRNATLVGWLPPMAWDDETIGKTEVTAEDSVYTRSCSVVDPSRSGRRPGKQDAPVDHIAVSEAVSGRRVALTQAEMTEAVATLDRMGYTAELIAERLGVTPRTVVRIRGRRAA